MGHRASSAGDAGDRRAAAVTLGSMRRAVCVALALALAMSAAPSGAIPRPHVSKRCGVVAKGSNDYRVRARAVRCSFATRWVKRYLRDRSYPRRWRCVRSRGKAPFYCTRGSVKAYWAERL
jgi:hypothetical protein